MILSAQGREYYQLSITTDPVTATTDWEASFDGGKTWVAVAGPNAPAATPAGQTVPASMNPLVRLAAAPELIVRGAPRISLT